MIMYSLQHAIVVVAMGKLVVEPPRQCSGTPAPTHFAVVRVNSFGIKQFHNMVRIK